MSAITVSKLAKIYRINPEKKVGMLQRSLKDDLARIWKSPGKLLNHGIFKILRRRIIQKINTGYFKSSKIDHLALKDVSFSVDSGKILGIVGSNGSGKSTLLKILSGITPPTHGKAVLTGKVASLLGIGIGFHSDLSGRDNIFLSGALLGFKKKDIEKDIDNIIDFAGIRKFIDTPVKYYSSGMYVRLAFSIATSNCLQPDIFLIDEVLSVGDISFQKKCLKRIKNLTRKRATTVIIVSHNMRTILDLSDQCLLLHAGKVHSYGDPKKVITEYQKILRGK